jgi:hypothetical protein
MQEVPDPLTWGPLGLTINPMNQPSTTSVSAAALRGCRDLRAPGATLAITSLFLITVALDHGAGA